MPTVKEVFVGDVGTVFEITIKEDGVVVDVSSATLKQILFLKPDGAVLTASAAFTTDGTDGKIQYKTLSGNINLTGIWHWQGKVTLATGGPFHTSVRTFRVESVIG